MRPLKSLLALALLLPPPCVMPNDLEFLLKTTPLQRATVQTRFMQEKLDLTPEATNKINGINLAYAEKVEPILKGSSMLLFKIQDIKAILQQKDEILRGTLSPQQYERYRESKDEIINAMRHDLEK
ncbi:hypothetical protein [Methylomonas sp. AM2-LC]|uniref:hypothetical protein n=1 Tax=Methylomonas sp. AM2-LC TaxID=3153301 RepID=UPI003262DCB8